LQENNNTNGNVDDILNIIAGVANASSDPVSVEMVFGIDDGADNVGLVFESHSDAPDEVEVPILAFEQDESIKLKEFSVPDKFVIEDGDKNAPAQQRIITGEFVPYVPRFTGAAEKLNSALARADKKRDNDEVAEDNSPIDPTAEIYTEDDGESPAVAVNVKTLTPADELGSESSSKVFKFLENEIPDERVEEIIDEEPPAADEPITPANEVVEVEEPVAEQEPEADEPHELYIPDPPAPSAVVNYVSAAPIEKRRVLFDAPDGVGDLPCEKARAEFTSYPERDSFKDKFLDSLISERIRFFAALIISLLLLGFETVCAFGIKLPTVTFASSFGTPALFDIPFVICLYLAAIPEIVSSFKAIISGIMPPEIFITTSFFVVLGYDVVCAFSSKEKYPLFGMIFAVSVLAAIGATYFKKNADFKAFKLVSENAEKRVIDNKFTRTLEEENAALDGVIGEHKSKIARTFRTAFVSDFFTNTRKPSENTRNVLIILASVLGGAIVTGVIAYFIPGGPIAAMSAFSLVFLLGCPAMSIMSHKLPYFYSMSENVAARSAAMGESMLNEYSEIDVITFEDTEVFGEEDVTLQRIMLFGNSENLTKALCQMSALFMNVGGPLDKLFANSLDRKPTPADNTYIEKDGVSGEIDGHTVLAGSLEYIISKGAVIPEGDTGTEQIPETTRIMYASEDGKVYAKFYVRYSFSEDFSCLLPVLIDEGIKPLVYTRDPNVTGDVVKTLTHGADRIRVLKRTTSPEGDDLLYRKVSAGLVSYGDRRR